MPEARSDGGYGEKFRSHGCTDGVENPVVEEIREEDQRVKLVRLTPQSLALKKSFKELSNKVNERVYRGFSVEEQSQLVQLLSKALKNY